MKINLSESLGPVRLAMIEVAVRANSRRTSFKSSCKSGCDHCCRTKFEITIAEAMVIMRHLKALGKWKDVRQKSLDQLKQVKGVNSLPWFMMGIACPLLDSRRMCSTYDVRPARCSTHFVTSSPDQCGPLSTRATSYDLVDMSDLRQWFDSRVLNHVDTYGILNVRLPVAAALILGERASVLSGVDFNQMVSLIDSEFR